MKKNFTLIALPLIVLFFSACDKENTNLDTTLYDDEISLISDEIDSDLTLNYLLDGSDDANFFDDLEYDLNEKSTHMYEGVSSCAVKTWSVESDRLVLTRDFSDSRCDRTGIIVIEYFFPETDEEITLKKTIEFIDFTTNSVTYNGKISLERTIESYSIEASLEIDRVNTEGEAVHFSRNYSRQLDWLCGRGTQSETFSDLDYSSYATSDNIRLLSGSSSTVKTVAGVETSYSRTITNPLLYVAACDLKIQAGEVVIKKANGTELEINYGEMPESLNCDDDFECGNTFEVTKNGKTYSMELADGEVVQVTQE
ncbi:hypothetical protein [Mangrovibacterium sp.]|uniref:hypothetical protein n=1 Tax=Mangrovibacterium sp. TaxID=1961364 RepID=UPI003561CE20